MQDRRLETRILCADLVDLRWKDPSKKTRRLVANLEDISQTGACLQVEKPIPLGTEVRMTYPKGELLGTIRYCVFREIGYFLGLEFDPKTRWTQQQYRPQHMLDPRRLVKNTTNRLTRRPGSTFVN